jgi:hypothetical protein
VSSVAETLRQATRVTNAMYTVTAQLGRGLSAISITVDQVGVFAIVTPGAEDRWLRTFPNGYVVAGGAQVPLTVQVEGSAS